MPVPEIIQAGIQAVQQRQRICDTLYRYSSAVDELDYVAVRGTLADDAWAQYGNMPPREGGDAIAAWIREATGTILWQHHHLTVYHVDVDGAEAQALSYLRSYQVYEDAPETAKIIVARYHDRLKLTGGGWKIARRVMEILWARSQDDDGYLAVIGGRGPKIWQRGEPSAFTDGTAGDEAAHPGRSSAAWEGV